CYLFRWRIRWRSAGVPAVCRDIMPCTGGGVVQRDRRGEVVCSTKRCAAPSDWSPMEIIGFPAGPLETNCYVATGHSMEADAADGPIPVVIIDPGMDALGRLKAECEQRNLEPEAVLLTHGHIDHTRDVGEVSREWGIPVYISPHD